MSARREMNVHGPQEMCGRDGGMAVYGGERDGGGCGSGRRSECPEPTFKCKSAVTGVMPSSAAERSAVNSGDKRPRHNGVALAVRPPVSRTNRQRTIQKACAANEGTCAA